MRRAAQSGRTGRASRAAGERGGTERARREKKGKGATQHAVYSREMSVCEPDYVRVLSQGPYGGGAVRCYTGNDPMRHAYCTRVRCEVRE